ncbi:MAG: ATP-binding protein [Muribaculaceae bacterium]|nr:ATP-binding protein [Muribaculaceae bacterium]
MNYKPRIVDAILRDKLDAMGAVLIEGAKACGKSTTGEQQAKSIIKIDEPDLLLQYRQLAQTNISKLLAGATPRLIDEWQIIPSLWDAVRHEVDKRSEDGQFILTGSSVPADRSEIQHSGAGRFAWLKMRPMSLWESGESSGEVSLKELFESPEEISGTNTHTLDDIAYYVCRGGWPKSVNKKTQKASLMQVFEYYNAIIQSDLSRVDGVNRDKERAERIMRSYARLQGTQATLGVISEDVSPNEKMKVSSETISSYLSALRKIFIIEDMKAWNPNLKSRTAIRTSDTRYYVDSSIAVAAMGLGPSDLINDMKTFGLLFETLCIRDLRVFADALTGEVYHYRDKNGLECDAVVHLRNGRYGLIEIKIGGDKNIDESAANLNKLASLIDIDRMRAPSFCMVLVGVGPYAYRRADGVYVVPIGCLKD